MIEFIESSHTYLLDGVIIPSVSNILSTVLFPNKYSAVNPAVLERAAQFGTNVHKAIETGFDLFLTEQEQEVYDRYLELVIKHNIKPSINERIVNTNDYAGTLDMIGHVGFDLSLLDIKTTYQLDKEYLSWQLSFYEYAYGFKFEKLYCIWLPKKGKAQLVEIQRKTEEELLAVIQEYKEKVNENRN